MTPSAWTRDSNPASTVQRVNDRRGAQRARLAAPSVTVTVGGKLVDAVGSDVSPGGMRLLASDRVRTVRVGDEVSLAFLLDGGIVVARGVVRWCARTRHDLFLFGVSFTASGCELPERPEAPPPRPVQDAKPKHRQVMFLPVTLPYWEATIIAMDKTSIVVRLMKTGKESQYPFHEALAGGSIQQNARYWNGYRVEDIRVGDIIKLGVSKEDDTEYCAELSILKRPGGLVPESAKKGELGVTYAKIQNAENAFKDFGIPIPEDCKLPVPRVPGSKK